MHLKIYTVDAFAIGPFTGNPAAVIPMKKKLSDEIMQKIAAEMNLSETAYLELKSSDGSDWSSCSRFGLRWMTPTNEVKLCGHATLASAHVLFFNLGNQSKVLEFETLSGVLKAERKGDEIVLDLPIFDPYPLTPSQIEVLLPVIKEIVGKRQTEEVLISLEARKLLVCLENTCTRNDLESIQPNFNTLLNLHDGSLIKGVIVTLKGELKEETSKRSLGKYHFVSRYFAPWNGIPEDPVTGSAHSVLGPYWSKKLGLKNFKCKQCSTRGGELALNLSINDRIEVAGKGITILEGCINI